MMIPKYDYCIYGGSFNPVTVGHMLVLNAVYSTCVAKEYLIMPCNVNDLKKHLVDPIHRINLLNIALKQNFPGADNISVTDFETKYEGPSESYITLQRLRDEYPGKSFVFIIGSDVLHQMPKWPMGLQFAQNADFIIATRNGYPIEDSDLAILNKYYLLDDLLRDANKKNKTSNASSTEARRLISIGDRMRLSELLTDDVIKYIDDKKLYV